MGGALRGSKVRQWRAPHVGHASSAAWCSTARTPAVTYSARVRIIAAAVCPETGRCLRTLCRVVLRPCLVKHWQVTGLQEIGEAVGSQTDVDRLPAPQTQLLRLRQRVEFDRAVRAGRVREDARLVAHR